ncbi:MAG TPA: alpha/beta hydrolase, partial [Gemmatales bacterium]|nr:alpha/beta hydrolase [Gemmatales bacterium]
MALMCLLLTYFLQPADPEPVQLWTGQVPLLASEDASVRPVLYPYLPKPEKATGAAVVVCPGGGYGALALQHEGKDIARWLNERGLAAFVLKYR